LLYFPKLKLTITATVVKLKKRAFFSQLTR